MVVVQARSGDLLQLHDETVVQLPRYAGNGLNHRGQHLGVTGEDVVGGRVRLPEASGVGRGFLGDRSGSGDEESPFLITRWQRSFPALLWVSLQVSTASSQSAQKASSRIRQPWRTLCFPIRGPIQLTAVPGRMGIWIGTAARLTMERPGANGRERLCEWSLAVVIIRLALAQKTSPALCSTTDAMRGSAPVPNQRKSRDRTGSTRPALTSALHECRAAI